MGVVLRALVVAALLLTALLAPPAPAATAGDDFCDSDPLVVVTTPRGALVPVHVTTSAEAQYLAQVTAAQIRYSVSAAGESGTQVTMTVLVPNPLSGRSFAARSVASTGPLRTGTIYASTTGTSGEPMTLRFKLDIP